MALLVSWVAEMLASRAAQREAERIFKIAHAEDAGEQRAAIVQIPFNVGDKVRVKDGTFAGMDGVIGAINAEKGPSRFLLPCSVVKHRSISKSGRWKNS